MTTDASARAKASAYEAQLWPYRDDLAFHIKDQFGAGRLSDAEAQKLTYSSGWGLAVYHTMDELVLLTHVLEATEDEQHRLWYAELAKEVLDISVPAIVEGRGTEACPKSASLYACSQGYFRYLDAGHGAGAAGFVMNAMYENPTLRAIYQQDLDGWAKALQPTLERHYAITESTAATKTPHMPAKIAAGYLAIGKILGETKYLDAFERVTKVLAASAETNTPAGWVGSDISHARVSAAVIHLAYREQLRGTLPVIVTPEHLAGIGDAFEAARQKYSANAGFVGSYVGDHGVFVAFSTGMAALVDPTYSFDNVTAGSHSFEWPSESLGALAMGHATRVVP